MSESMLVPVILAGGVGSRLWPLSRDLYPKQLLSLIGEQSLLQATVARAAQIPTVSHIIIVCNQQYQFLVKEQLEILQTTYPITFDLILEPVGKNTAPALALATLRATELDATFLLALPADHLIGDALIFAEQLEKIMPHVGNKLVTFGIKPTYPETGYGYIEADRSLSAQPNKISPTHTVAALQEAYIFPINRFVEKPDLATAESYCQQENYYWNSGMFLYQPANYLNELNTYLPDLLHQCERTWAQKTHQAESILLDLVHYTACADISIDYAVMEKTHLAMMAPLSTTWDDVGSWLAVSKLESSDRHGNVCVGDVVALDSEGCYLRSESRLVTAVGLKNQIVVETADAVLVVDKTHAQNVKHLVAELKKQKRKEAESHAILYQPWGHYEVLCEGQGFVVKQVTLKPSGVLSDSTEEDMCEHWVVLSGTAHVLVQGLSSLLSANQFVDILPGTKYRFENETSAPLTLLSIQTSRGFKDA